MRKLLRAIFGPRPLPTEKSRSRKRRALARLDEALQRKYRLQIAFYT